MKAAVIVLPGSNCDHDCYHVLKHVIGAETQFVWHKERTLPPADLVVVPGGFSYGDYLRAGAIARFSPVMEAVVEHAERGGLVFGICNGFQILTEARLLPGALLRNRSLKFVCQDVDLRVERGDTALTLGVGAGTDLTIPVAHAEGCYYADPETRRRLAGEGRVLFRYLEPDGAVAEYASVNGSVDGIAGVMNEGANVFGMMPHPERCAEVPVGGPAHGSGNTDGRLLFEALLASVEGGL
ncbi:MAG: phosphoribosylformylglycinamidine synthase subunit PurQ [Myxococcota bacterium]